MSTLTVYPEAGNGYCQCEQGSSSWANVQGETGETGVTTSLGATINEAVGPARVNGTNYRLGRFFIPFDTSGLGAGATVTATTLSVYVVATDDDDNDGDDWVNVVQTTQGATNTLATSDYELCGDSIDDPTEGATRIDIGDMGGGAYEVWTLDATGRGWVTVDGDTLLGLREGHDALDNEPAVDGGRNILDVRTVAYADVTSDPKLFITYTPAPSSSLSPSASPSASPSPSLSPSTSPSPSPSTSPSTSPSPSLSPSASPSTSPSPSVSPSTSPSTSPSPSLSPSSSPSTSPSTSPSVSPSPSLSPSVSPSPSLSPSASPSLSPSTSPSTSPSQSESQSPSASPSTSPSSSPSWAYEEKNETDYSNKSKNTTTFSNKGKNTSSWSNKPKNTLT